MALVFNGTAIPPTFKIMKNGVCLGVLKYGDTVVWERAVSQPTITSVVGDDNIVFTFTNTFENAVYLVYYFHSGATYKSSVTVEVAPNSSTTATLTNADFTAGSEVTAEAYSTYGSAMSTTTSSTATMPGEVSEIFTFTITGDSISCSNYNYYGYMSSPSWTKPYNTLNLVCPLYSNDTDITITFKDITGTSRTETIHFDTSNMYQDYKTLFYNNDYMKMYSLVTTPSFSSSQGSNGSLTISLSVQDNMTSSDATSTYIYSMLNGATVIVETK